MWDGARRIRNSMLSLAIRHSTFLPTHIYHTHTIYFDLILLLRHRCRENPGYTVQGHLMQSIIPRPSTFRRSVCSLEAGWLQETRDSSSRVPLCDLPVRKKNVSSGSYSSFHSPKKRKFSWRHPDESNNGWRHPTIPTNIWQIIRGTTETAQWVKHLLPSWKMWALSPETT